MNRRSIVRRSALGLWLFACLAVCAASPLLRAAQPGDTQSTRALQVVTIPQAVRPLPGGLDDVPVLNSNSPEVVQQEGILVSTLPKEGTAHPEAHLDYPFTGRFDVFAHHICRCDAGTPHTLFIAVILSNRQEAPVTVDVLSAASYLSQPDAPFVDLPAMQENPEGTVYAGPGDRVSDDILRGKRQAGWPTSVVVPPHGTAVLACLPIPIANLTPALNGRTLLSRLYAHGAIYGATLAMFAPIQADGSERSPTDAQWQDLLFRGALAGPREKPASSPDAPGPVIYGRVAGVSKGSSWTAALDNPPAAQEFHIPGNDLMVSYPVSSLIRGTFGTGQIQSAPLLVREADTAYAAHGNYGVEYRLVTDFVNDARSTRTVRFMLQTPLKVDDGGNALSFFRESSSHVFFRGTIKLEYVDEKGASQVRYVHLVQHQAEQGKPLCVLTLKPGERRPVTLTFLYPADATPPQVVTISSAANVPSNAAAAPSNGATTPSRRDRKIASDETSQQASKLSKASAAPKRNLNPEFRLAKLSDRHSRWQSLRPLAKRS